ncbi:hypothetical protein KAT92_06200 [Candidatus Babeliales bacterium]|nr:hypothetical protein [Candidatus Babeliales bacterium]
MDVEIEEDINDDDIEDILKRSLKRFETGDDIMIMSVDVVNNDTDEVIVTTF